MVGEAGYSMWGVRCVDMLTNGRSRGIVRGMTLDKFRADREAKRDMMTGSTSPDRVGGKWVLTFQSSIAANHPRHGRSTNEGPAIRETGGSPGSPGEVGKEGRRVICLESCLEDWRGI